MTKRWIVWLAWLMCLVAIANATQTQSSQAPVTSASQFDPQPWLDDFHDLTSAMASHYADLDWAINDRRMNLPKLRQDTEEKLRHSSDEPSARRVLQEFLDAFGDGHLSISWATPASESSTAPPGSGSLCGRLNYKTHAQPGIDFSLLPGFSKVAGEAFDLFSGGLLTLANGTKLGLIRIAEFSEHAFPTECEKTIQEIHLNNESQCDQECEDRIATQTGDRLTAAITKRVQQLHELGASGLLLDITRNGGGSDWYEAVSRSLSSVPLTDARRGFIKHEHWTTELESELWGVEADLKNGKEPSGVLEEAAIRLRTAVARSKEPCDRSHVFNDGKVGCSLVVDDILFWSGVLPYARPGSFASLESRTTLFHPLQFEYSEDSRRLLLYIAVDRQSWSTAERFASLLQDNGAATIVGELTGGAGCGYTNGGMPTVLTHSRAQVKMPDCLGLRKDGSNGNDGVTPDVLVPWAARDTSFTRATKLLRALDKTVGASQARRSGKMSRSRD
jgi:hypothetical protein